MLTQTFPDTAFRAGLVIESRCLFRCVCLSQLSQQSCQGYRSKSSSLYSTTWAIKVLYCQNVVIRFFFKSKVNFFSLSSFNLCKTLQPCVVLDNFASKQFCNFDAFQSIVLSRIFSFDLNCQTPMITVKRHLTIFT